MTTAANANAPALFSPLGRVLEALDNVRDLAINQVAALDALHDENVALHALLDAACRAASAGGSGEPLPAVALPAAIAGLKQIARQHARNHEQLDAPRADEYKRDRDRWSCLALAMHAAAHGLDREPLSDPVDRSLVDDVHHVVAERDRARDKIEHQRDSVFTAQRAVIAEGLRANRLADLARQACDIATAEATSWSGAQPSLNDERIKEIRTAIEAELAPSTPTKPESSR